MNVPQPRWPPPPPGGSAPLPYPPPPHLPPGGRAGGPWRRWWPVGVAVLVLVAALVAVTTAGRSDDDTDTAADSTVTTRESSVTTAPADEADPADDPGLDDEPPDESGPLTDPESPTSILNVELTVTRPKVVDPLPLCDDMVTVDQISAAVGGVSLSTMSNNGAQPCFYLSDDRQVAVSVGTQSPLYDLNEIGVEDPATSIGPAELEGNTRFAFVNDETGSCQVFVVVNLELLPTFLVAAVDAPGDACAAANALVEQAFTALPDA